MSLIFLLASPAFASETNGTIDTSSKYAWGENLGWINFGCDGCDVEVTDTTITGYAWSAQYGWINLSPSTSGVSNNGEGVLAGSAWGSNVGWIDFTGVTINSTGEFLGYATVDSDASQISFNCVNGLSCASADFKVKTDWRPASGRQSNGGGSSGSKPNPPANPPLPPPANPPPFGGLPPGLSPVAGIPSASLSAGVINSISNFISYLFRPDELPPAVVQVPKIAPPTLGARWNLLPEKAIAAFVFAPLPYELRLLASKFPELDKTFKEVGIERFTDMNKLAGVDLNIPGLSDVLNTTIKNIGPSELAELESLSGVSLNVPGLSSPGGKLPSSVGTGNIALIEGLPVAQFSVTAKKNLPTEFVFARGASELVDLNVALSVADNGDVSQRVSSLPGQTLKLVIKPISAARSVTGYIVFVAATPRVSENEILRSSLAASALFSMEGLVQNVPTNEIPIEKKLVLSTFEYEDPDHDGIYTADVTTPVVPGEYEVVTIIDYIDPELGSRRMSMVTVVDPEGYVFEENNGKETRIPSAIVSLYKLNTSTKSYDLWNADDYSQQNPQITDVRGTYSFLVPAGTYYFNVEAPGYKSFTGKAFIVTEGNGIHQNIELKSSTGASLSGIDWQTFLLIVVLLLLVYNLYRNTLRDKLTELLKKNGKQ
ncbi:MAG: carboxypeptidase-like regulatory domain-containing protein [Candidatus Paceibacterota bacterium]